MKKIINEQEISFVLPIVGQTQYLLSKNSDYGWFADENCLIAFFIDKRVFFKRLVFTTNVVKINSQVSIKDEKRFLDDIIDYIKLNDICDFIYKAQSNVVFNVCPKDSVCVPWGTYQVFLDKTPDELFKSFNQKSRNVIRNAMKSNVYVEKCDNVQAVYENIKDTLVRQKSIHYPSLDYLNSLHKINENAILFIVKKEQIIQGSLVLLYDDNQGYAMYAGSIKKPATGSLDLLHFEAMKFLQKKGINIYDFVGTRLNISKGSKQEGIDKFKRKFNPVLIEGYAFMSIIKPIKYYMFNLLSKVYLVSKGYKYADPILKIQDENLGMKI